MKYMIMAEGIILALAFLVLLAIAFTGILFK